MEINDGHGGSDLGLPPHVRRMKELGQVVDEIIDAEKQLAIAAAHRASLIEKARLLSVADAVANVAEAASASADPMTRSRDAFGWSADVVAQRELATEIACALRIPERTAQTLVAHSRILENDLPGTKAALSAGDISYRHAEKLIDHALSLSKDAVTSFEDAALPHARELTVAKFDRKARVIRERIHPELITVRSRAARELRDLYVDPARDGMAYLTAYLPAEVAVAGYNRVDDFATSLRGPDDPRTRAQLRADVFADLIIDGITEPEEIPAPPAPLSDDDLSLLFAMQVAATDHDGIEYTLEQITAGVQADIDAKHAMHDARTRASSGGLGRGIRATVAVTVPVLALLDRDDEGDGDHGPAILEGYGPIGADVAKRLAAGAPSFTRILTHPETGTILSVGRSSYAVPADLRRWLQFRDETCRYAGCSKRASRCEADHSVDWSYDGETRHDNLAFLCDAHHHLRHQTRWRYRHQDEIGTLEWTSPTGHTYTTRPATPMRTPQFS